MIRKLRHAAFVVLMAGSVHATPLLYQLTSGPVSGPPYPTAPITMNVTTSPQSPIPAIGILSLQFESVVSEIGLLLTPGAAVGGVNPQPFLPIAVSLLNAGDLLPPVLIVGPCLDVDPFGNSVPVLGAPEVMAPVPNDGKVFDVFFDITVEDGAAQQKVHFEIGAGQPLSFLNPQAVQGHSIDMSFELIRLPGVALAQGPLFTMTLSGEASPVPEPGSGVLFLPVLALARVLIKRKGWARP